MTIRRMPPLGRRFFIHLQRCEGMDSRLYVITGNAFLQGRRLEDVILQAIQGGADCIQLREKELSSRELLETGRLLRRITAENNIRFIVNDRLDIALAVDADGVHLGQDDLPIDVARRLLGPEKIIGISTHDAQEAIAAEKAGADYIGVGPIKATQSKSDAAPAIGLEGVQEIRRHVSLPIVAIGGIKQDDVAGIIRSGANGIAVISAIIGADDVYQAASAMRSEVDRIRRDPAWN